MVEYSKQSEAVLNHMRTKGSITSIEAIYEHGVTRTAAVIYDLKKKGFIIGDKMESGTNRYNTASKWKRYWIISEPEEKESD